jgi:hypothetical protein
LVYPETYIGVEVPAEVVEIIERIEALKPEDFITSFKGKRTAYRGFAGKTSYDFSPKFIKEVADTLKKGLIHFGDADLVDGKDTKLAKETGRYSIQVFDVTDEVLRVLTLKTPKE